MARIVLTATFIVSLTVLIGCQTTDSGEGQRLPPGPGTLPSSVSVAGIRCSPHSFAVSDTMP